MKVNPELLNAYMNHKLQGLFAQHALGAPGKEKPKKLEKFKIAAEKLYSETIALRFEAEFDIEKRNFAVNIVDDLRPEAVAEFLEWCQVIQHTAPELSQVGS